MIGVFLFLAMISIAALFANIWSLNKGNEEIGNCFSIVVFAIILFISTIGITFVNGDYKSISPLLGHIDKDKTKTSETNGEITDLWITVDGEEHHFELKHEGENEHDK